MKRSSEHTVWRVDERQPDGRGDAATDAVERAQRMPKLRVGLHLDGRGWPDGAPRIEQVRAIVNAKGRLSDRFVAAGIPVFLSARRPAAHCGPRSGHNSKRFGRAGLTLDHVDTHRHMVLHPTVSATIVDLAPEFGIPGGAVTRRAVASDAWDVDPPSAPLRRCAS